MGIQTGLWLLTGGWLVCALLSGCSPQQKQSEALFELVASEHSGVHFSNTIIESDSLSVLTFDYIYNGGGVAIGDINNDSLPDIFFTGNQVSSRLYLNKGDFHFEDITRHAGLETNTWAEGVTMADVNHDGWLDIYVCTSSHDILHPSANLLFINQGNQTFKEQAREYGIAKVGYATQAAFFDYDRDGDLDLYVLLNATGEPNKNTTRPKRLNGEAPSTDKLFRNDTGRRSVSPSKREPGRSDVSGVFTDVSREAGILAEGYGLGLALGDLDQDGWTDVYTSNDFLSNDLLYMNNERGGFRNDIARLLKHQSYNGMGVDIADVNNDGWLDIFELDMLPETNRRQKLMFGSMNYDRFKLNLRTGYEPQYVRNTFQLNNGPTPETSDRPAPPFKGKEVSREHIRPLAKGVPGRSDVSEVSFSEIGQLAGVHSTDWSWSALLADYDNDGFRDLLITNGYGKDITDQDYTVYSRAVSQFGTQQNIRMQLRQGMEKIKEVKLNNYLYRNNGADQPGNLTFSNQSAAWGMQQASISNGAAYADLDRDGDLDLVINNLNQEAFIYRNNGEKLLQNHFLQLRLVGDSLNTGGIGAKIRLKYQGNLQYAEQFTTRGYKSSMEPTVHFGLGKAAKVDSLEITWPDGRYQLLTNVRTNQWLTLNQKEAQSTVDRSIVDNPRSIIDSRKAAVLSDKVQHLPPSTIDRGLSTEPLVQNVTREAAIAFRHQEKDFSDFRVQPLIPFKHSQNGPGMAVADVNGDGLQDFYVGGASEQPGMLFYQLPNGQFNGVAIKKPTTYEEDLGALFFDADGDGDPDLYVVSGSSEFPMGSRYYQDRLYKNEGKGQLTLDTSALPAMNASGSCVVAADYDHDGDLDLFVGGRVSPGQYPLPPRSYLLQNNGGKFRDVTAAVCPALQKIGMVTAALWTDFDNDQQPDLIIAGEWMPLTFFKNQQGKLVAWNPDAGKINDAAQSPNHQLANSTGWWNSLTPGDFDNDGDTDYLAGNLGLNSKFKASEQEPVSLYAKDFDRNGSLDPVLCYFIQGKNHPAHPRDDMIDQIVALRGRFPRYADYAQATFDQVFTKEELHGAYELTAKQLQTCYLENLGQGKFRLKPLPIRAQFAPVFGILAQDFDGDGNLDALLTGNSYASEILTGWYDASIGLYLKGDGKGNFTPVSAAQSGFFVDKDAKALVQLPRPDGKILILSASNDDSLSVFTTTRRSQEWSPVQPGDQYVDIWLKDGRKRKEEFYYGSGYLSQSARGWWITPQMDHFVMHGRATKTNTGTIRPVALSGKKF